MRKQHSYSELLSFKTCGRKWQHRYQYNIYPLKISDALIKGTVFHAALREYFQSRNLNNALRAAGVALTNEVGEDNVKYNEVWEAVKPAILYHLPRVDPSGRYSIMTDDDLFNYLIPPGVESVQMLEYRFAYGKFFGYVDAVLWDKELEEPVLVDFKFRKTINPIDKVDIDSQIPFYVAVLNKMGANINKAVMWQFRTVPPAPAKTKQVGRGKNKHEGMSEASQTTTWPYWVETLPEWFNEPLSAWAKKLDGKLKPESYFMDKSYIDLSAYVLDAVLDNQMSTITMMEMVRDYVESGGQLPGLLSGYACSNCDYLKLCTAEMHNHDASELFKEDYYVKT